MITVIDYGSGNIGSILNMLKKIGAPAHASADPKELRSAEKIILPGVGAFDRAVTNLENAGLLPVLNARVREDLTPILGICLGMQLLAEGSEEGVRPGLGWIEGKVRKFQFTPGEARLKVPHMGWNTIAVRKKSPLLEGLEDGARFYFAHSYHLVCRNPDDELTRTFHGYDFISAVSRGNVYGVQFHPEKSHRFGLALFRNFVQRC